jgi:hypothetical protein
MVWRSALWLGVIAAWWSLHAAASYAPYLSGARPNRRARPPPSPPLKPKQQGVSAQSVAVPTGDASHLSDYDRALLLTPGVADPRRPYDNLLATMPERDTTAFDRPPRRAAPAIQVCRFAEDVIDTAMVTARGNLDMEHQPNYAGVFFSLDTQVNADEPMPTLFTNFRSILMHFTPEENLRGHYERWLLFDIFKARPPDGHREPITQVFQTKAWEPLTWERYSGASDVPVPVGTPSCIKYDDAVKPEMAAHIHDMAKGWCWHFIELAMQSAAWYADVTDSVEGAMLGEQLCAIALANSQNPSWDLWPNFGLARHEARTRQVRVSTARYFAIMKKIVQGEVFLTPTGEPAFESPSNPYSVAHPGMVWDVVMEGLAVGLQDLDIEFCQWLATIVHTPVFRHHLGENNMLPPQLKHLTPLIDLYAHQYTEAIRGLAAVYADGDPRSDSPEFLIGFLLFWLETRIREEGNSTGVLQDPFVRDTIAAARKDYDAMMEVSVNDYRGFVLPSPPPLRVGPGDTYHLRETKWKPTRLDHMPTREEWQGFMRRREPFILSLQGPAAPDKTSAPSAEDLYGPMGPVDTWGSNTSAEDPVQRQRARAGSIQQRGGTSSSYIRLLHTHESDRQKTAAAAGAPNASSAQAVAYDSCPLLMQAFGWNTCNWNEEYLCHHAGAETVSLASANRDNGANISVFSGTSRLRRRYIKYCDYVHSIFDPHHNISSPTYFDAGSIAERKSGASSIYQAVSSTGTSIYGFPLDRMQADIPMPEVFTEVGLDAKGVSFWMGTAHEDDPGVSGLHYDRFDNFHVLLRGRKEWKVFSPADVMNMEYVVPPHYVSASGDVDQMQGHKQVEYYRYYGYNTVTRFSRAVSAHVAHGYKYDEFPNLHKTTMLSFTLHAGEALYLPSGWAHDVSSVGVHQAITYWFDCGEICNKTRSLL